MHVVVAEERAFPAAEAVIGDRDRDGDVDADHADLRLGGEIAGGVAVAGEDCGAVAELMIVDHLDGGIVIRRAHHRENRAENLFLVDLHLGRDAVEQARADIIAALIALQRQVATVHHQLGAFLHAVIDIAAHFVEMHLAHERTHLGIAVRAGADLDLLDLGLQRFDQRVARLVAHRDRHRDRHAALAGGAIGGAHQRIRGHVEIGVGQHDGVVLGAAERLHPFAVGAARGIDIFGDRGGADEAHCRDIRVFEDGIDRHLVAMDDAENAFRATGLLEKLGHEIGCGRVLLRRLQDEGVAAGERDREHPHRHHGGEVERRDAGHHAQGLAHGIAVDSGADRLAELALHQMRDAAGELDHFEAAGDRARRVA